MTIHLFATACPLPELPPRGAGRLGDFRENSFVRHEDPNVPSGASLLHCKTTEGQIGFQTNITKRADPVSHDTWAYYPVSHDTWAYCPRMPTVSVTLLWNELTVAVVLHGRRTFDHTLCRRECAPGHVAPGTRSPHGTGGLCTVHH